MSETSHQDKHIFPSLSTDLIRIGEALYIHETGDLAAFTIILTKATGQTPKLVELHQLREPTEDQSFKDSPSTHTRSYYPPSTTATTSRHS